MTEPSERITVLLTVNDRPVTQVVEARRSLADFLREDLSCMTLALDARGRKIKTIEGLAEGEKLHPVQEQFIEHDAMQCGFCTPGMIVTVTELLAQEPTPSTETIREAISGNLCMCTGYVNIVRAVEQTVAGRAPRARA